MYEDYSSEVTPVTPAVAQDSIPPISSPQPEERSQINNTPHPAASSRQETSQPTVTPPPVIRNNYSPIPAEPEPEKKSGWGQKLLLAVCMGLLFGVFAGGGFYGVVKGTNLLDDFKKTESVSESVPSESVQLLPNTTQQEGIKEETITSETNVGTAINASSAKAVSEVVEQVMPAMVSIVNTYTYTQDYGFGGFFGGGSYTEEAQASGTGIMIGETDTEYLIVTNHHVIESANSLEVTFVDGSSAAAYLKGSNSERDLAVIAVQKADLTNETIAAINIAQLGDSTSLKLGEDVVAIGNALGYGQSVTSGIVSALDREVEGENGITGKFIQTDAAINPGNSGGALLNMNGEVIGINSSKIGGTYVEGIGYAIPVSDVLDIISGMMTQTTKIKVADDEVGYLGIELQEVTTSMGTRWNMPVGIYIVNTIPGCAAAEAGLQSGDIITHFDGEKISSYDDLSRLLQYYSAGTTIEVTYQRQTGMGYEEATVMITLGTRPTNE